MKTQAAQAKPPIDRTETEEPEEKDRKLTISVTPRLHAELRQMARERETTITDLFRRAIALEKFLYQHQDAEIVIRDGSEITKLVLADRL